MPGHPDRTVLYPEIAAAGSLAAALQEAAVSEGLPVVIAASTSRSRVDVPSPLPYRQGLEVTTEAAERAWSVTGRQQERGMPLVEGRTTDLAEVVRAVQAWHDGAALEEILTVAPLLRSTGRFDVPDGDPVRMVASEWQGLLAELAHGDTSTDRSLVEAAHADPALRQLYPFTSMHTLLLSTCIRYPFRCPLPWVEPTSGGYVVGSPGGVLLGETTTADEAVAMVRPWLSDDDVPVVVRPDPRPVHDPLEDETWRRFDDAGAAPWFRVEGTTVDDWQRLFDMFTDQRYLRRWPWRYAEGGVERDLPAKAADVFARPAGAPPVTVNQVVPSGECSITFRPVTPDEICFTADLQPLGGEARYSLFVEKLMDVELSLPRRWVLMAPQDDPARPVLALRTLSRSRFRLL